MQSLTVSRAFKMVEPHLFLDYYYPSNEMYRLKHDSLTNVTCVLTLSRKLIAEILDVSTLIPVAVVRSSSISSSHAFGTVKESCSI